MIVKNTTLIKAISCKEETNACDVAKILEREKQRRIIVVDDNDYPLGIISTTDLSNKVVAKDLKPGDVTAKEIMTSPIYLTCNLDDELSAIYKKMVEHESFFVPVLKERKLYGILTYGELMKRMREVIKQ